jgi:hypothetical protein
MCMYVYVMCVHIMCSSDLLKTCELACGSKVSHNESSIFCIIFFTQSARSRDNLERLLVAHLISDNETLSNRENR